MEFIESADNYEYDFLSILNKDLNLFYNTDVYSDILLCVYCVDTSGKYPFLKYLLANSGHNTLLLPRIPIFSSFNKNNLISYSKVFLSGILQVDNFVEFNKKVEFNGYYDAQLPAGIYYQYS